MVVDSSNSQLTLTLECNTIYKTISQHKYKKLGNDILDHIVNFNYAWNSVKSKFF